MICLSLAIASIGRAMQRQSDNRHHLITQVRVMTLLYVLALTDRRAGYGISFPIPKTPRS